MSKNTSWILVVLAVLALGAGAMVSLDAEEAPPSWALNATIIEACSCPMFCQCYFNTSPAAHHGHGGDSEHFCRFNNAFQVNHGSYGDVDLAGTHFWVAGDLGGDFSEGKMDWAVLTFDPAVTAEQRQGIAAILGHVYPVEWNSFTVQPDAAMQWKGGAQRAEARLGEGKLAEVVLNAAPSRNGEPVVIQNLTYWGVPRNDGFVLMPNEVQAYRAGDKAFETRGTNGFMITIDISSADG